MGPQEKHLTSEPALLILTVETMPLALSLPSVAGRIKWDNRCERALKAEAASQEGGVSNLLVCSCGGRVLAGAPAPEQGPQD